MGTQAASSDLDTKVQSLAIVVTAVTIFICHFWDLTPKALSSFTLFHFKT